MLTTTTAIPTLNKPPNTICGGFIDAHGIWNNGFACPVQHFVQYLCCQNDNDYYCCPPERYLSEVNYSYEPIYLSGQYQPADPLIVDRTSSSSLIAHSNIINRQFEQFQRLFLPIFLLTSSILFLIGIAIWFWLYKHKAFYATQHEDSEARNPVVRRTSSSASTNSSAKKRESINLTMQQHSRRILHPSTEV